MHGSAALVCPPPQRLQLRGLKIPSEVGEWSINCRIQERRESQRETRVAFFSFCIDKGDKGAFTLLVNNGDALVLVLFIFPHTHHTLSTVGIWHTCLGLFFSDWKGELCKAASRGLPNTNTNTYLREDQARAIKLVDGRFSRHCDGSDYLNRQKWPRRR